MRIDRILAACLLLPACAGGDPTMAGDPDEVVSARIVPRPFPDLMVGQTLQVRLETVTRGGDRYQTTTADWRLTDGSGAITATGVLTPARSGTLTGLLLGARADVAFRVFPFPASHPLHGAWQVTRWVRAATDDAERFDLLGSGYQAVAMTLSAVDQGLAYGRVHVAGADASGKTQQSSGTVVAGWPDRLTILLLPDRASTFPLRLEDGVFTWELQGGVLYLTQTDTTRWLFPSGRLREARDVIELVR